MRKSWKMIWIAAVPLVLALVLLGGAFIAWGQNRYTVAVTVRGQQDITLEVGTVYEESGADAQVAGSIFDKDPRNLPVTISGVVDTSRVGTYQLDYTAEYSNHHFLGKKTASGQAVRYVHVVDTQPPVLRLDTVAGSYTLPGQPYLEEGFTAFDNYDGDLTAKVESWEQDGIVYYTVTDSSGNQTQLQRKIVYDDPIAPELTLQGDSIVLVERGSAYTDPGYTATDNCDGDLTAKVEISGLPDVDTLGKYDLTYTVTDAWGNTTQAQRSVVVVKEIFPPIPQGVGGEIYLTFDDGPSQHTLRLLDILDKYNVKATFFVVGAYNMEIVAEIARRGHSVGNHTYSHNYSKVYASVDSFFNELYSAQSRIKSATGYKTKLIRFPGGSSNKLGVSMTELTRAVSNAGYVYFDWNVDSKDAVGATTAYEVYYNVCSGVANKKTAIVLQHDIKGYSVDAVEAIIQWGLANGYTFLPLTTSSPTAHHRLQS